jgi:hypothetical protein
VKIAAEAAHRPEHVTTVPVTPTDTRAVCAVAARNNADWCALVCRSHGIPNTTGEAAWFSTRRAPPFYPDAVTLRPDATRADFLTEIDTASPGCSAKDSFATLDLTSNGFVELLTAQWIHRPAQLSAPDAPTLHTTRITTATQLRDWQAAWHGGGAIPDVFRPALLAEPSVLILALHDGDALCGGAVLNRSRGRDRSAHESIPQHPDVAAGGAL